MKGRKVIDGHKFRTELAKLIPNYELDLDCDGQVIIYTNLEETTYDDYTEMEKS